MKWLKKGFLALGFKDQNETSRFEVLDSGDRIILKFSSEQEEWIRPGKAAYSLLNNEDYLVFFDHVTSQTIMLDFDQAQALRALLKMNDRANNSTFTHYEKK